MKRLLALLLMLGIMTGMFGQSIAFAGVPITPAATVVSRNGMNCMENMQGQQPVETPCKHPTLACMAASGGTALALADSAFPQTETHHSTVTVYWPATRVMVGADLAPSTRPPNPLG